MINNYKYITTIYFKRAFFIANSKGFLRAYTLDASLNILRAQ